MSHFAVGVLVKKGDKSLEELLAPYQQNNMGDCPEEFLKFMPTEDIDYEKTIYEKYKDDYEDFHDYMTNQGYEYNEETKEYGYWENPNAQWDWYEVGGRWSGILLNKKGNRVDECKLKDIDWTTMYEKSKKEAEERWDSAPEGIHRFFAGIHKDDTRESYVKRQSEFSTYAVITPDGEWHSKGDMGWFGISSETEEESKAWDLSFFNRFIKDADQELTLVIVDCHI